MLAFTNTKGLQLLAVYTRGSIRAFASRASADTGTEEEQRHTRDWLARLNAETIPRRVGEISFSRSSGPGGQNVNKVNSKATLRVPLGSLESLVPSLIYSQLQASSFYARKSDSILIQYDASRKQNDNIEGCWTKLYDLIRDAAKEVVTGETSPEQAAKVKELKRKENEARIRMKKTQSAKKSSRRGGGSYD